MLIDLIFVLSIKFFLFDFSHYKKIRNYFNSFNNFFISKLLKCPFCQGFWCGFFTSIIKYQNILQGLYFGFVSAIICLSWNVIFWPLIDKYEELYDN